MIELALTESERHFGLGYDVRKTYPEVLKPNEYYIICPQCFNTLQIVGNVSICFDGCGKRFDTETMQEITN